MRLSLDKSSSWPFLPCLSVPFVVSLFYCLTERQAEVYHKVCRKVNHDMSNSFSVFVMRLRELQGEESVSAFARRLQIKQQTLDACIKGKRKPSAEMIYKVACNCKVTSDWLLGLTDQRAPFIEVPRQNNVSKTPEIRGKFPSFGRPVCRSVRQFNRTLNPQEITDLLCNLTNRITQLETQLAALQSTSIATCG